MNAEPTAEPTSGSFAAAAGGVAGLDLDAIEQDLADVEVALERLDAGTYRVDEVSGAALPDDLLAQHPTARRLPER